MKNLAFLGIQGSGKGTQAVMLKKKYGFEHISIGQMLRDHMADDTPLGQKINGYMDKGELVPDEYVFSLLEELLNNDPRGLIFDGFPRTIRQAEFAENRLALNYAIYFELDDRLAIERVTSRRVCKNCKKDYNLIIRPPKEENKCDNCGGKLIQRSDDHESAIKKRLKIFHERTKPVTAFFEERNDLIRIDASQSPEEIHNMLVRSVNLEK